MNFKFAFLFVFAVVINTNSLYAQDRLTKEFEPIQRELVSWDPIRGQWLAESMMAISQNKPIPDRTFPEDFTPSEMLSMVPQNNRDRIHTTVEANRAANQNSGSLNAPIWNEMSLFIQRNQCELATGRSYGDPHLASFDGKSFSLQTVGEFVLTRSLSGKFQVQTRQRPDSDDFSLNTAVAMDVCGDRVCIYADDKPDSDLQNPVRVDGRSVRVDGSTYYLPHGGNIRNTGNQYIVTWPTGEKVTAQITNRTKFNFLNVTTQIYPCANGGYEGLLGNANGNPNDDINTRGNSYNNDNLNRFNTAFGVPNSAMSNEAEKEYLAYLAREFGHAWRVSPTTSLFDYAPGQSTAYFTDYSFPRYHRTVRDLSQAQRDAARRDCENNGVSSNELEGCIFDRGHINLPPNPRPTIPDPTRGVVLPDITHSGAIRNVNPVQPTVNSTPKPTVIGTGEKEIPTPKPVIQSKPVGSGTTIGQSPIESKENNHSTKPVQQSPVLQESKTGNTSTISRPIEAKPAIQHTPKPIEQSVNHSAPPAPQKPVIDAPKPAPKPVANPTPVQHAPSGGSVPKSVGKPR
jgi:hypothetical protein